MRIKPILCIIAISMLCNSSYCHATDNSDRLNSEIYDIADGVINTSHFYKCFDLSSELARSAVEYYTPLVPIALTECETGSWADRSVTWSSAIYSDLLNISWDDVSIYDIDESFYNINMLNRYIGCGSNCSSDYHDTKVYGHTGTGANDNDSIGSLQVLRRYLQDSNGIKRYKCGAVVTDLMRWEDNVQYFFHEHGGRILQCITENKNRQISSVYELVALVGVSHNTGSSFLSSPTAGSTWKSSNSVFELCNRFSISDVLDILNTYVDEWFSSIEYKLYNDTDFSLLGQLSVDKIDAILYDCGIYLSDYAYNITHKQYYPIRAVLNYMSLERLYGTIK